MSNTYNWTIDQMVCKPTLDGKTHVVSKVHWRASASDGTNEVSIYGQADISYDGNQTFEEYASLDTSRVFNWVYASGVDREAINTELDAKLVAKANPKEIILPLPWIILN